LLLVSHNRGILFVCQCVAVRCSALQCVAACCTVLQCVLILPCRLSQKQGIHSVRVRVRVRVRARHPLESCILLTRAASPSRSLACSLSRLLSDSPYCSFSCARVRALSLSLTRKHTHAHTHTHTHIHHLLDPCVGVNGHT